MGLEIVWRQMGAPHSTYPFGLMFTGGATLQDCLHPYGLFPQTPIVTSKWQHV